MPYRFNASPFAAPAAVRYDGHVSMVSVERAFESDLRVRSQTARAFGLWSRDTPYGEDGDSNDLRITDGGPRDRRAPVDRPTSFHVLTTDGILGRDVAAE